MSNIARMMQRATAGAGGAGLDVDEVFSCHLYDGNSGTQSIVNGIDLSGEGGLVWIKRRDGNLNHALFDTERGAGAYFASDLTAGHYTGGDDLTAFNSNGFTLGDGQFTSINYSSYDYVSWTFRKAEKFFDVVTWTGNGNNYRNISHNLGSVPGHVMVKKTSGGSAAGWINWHRTFSDYQSVFLNTTEAVYSGGSNGGVFGQASGFTSTQFQLGGPDNITYHNENGSTYVAYLFAHNNNDGEFGPDSDQDIIKCGSYTGNGSTTGPEINLGFEPQWVMIKVATGTTDEWVIFDTMRGIATGGDDQRLFPSRNLAELSGNNYIDVTSTGFKPTLGADLVNRNTSEYIYMAIRRGPLAVPDDATKVFSMDTQGSSAPYFDSNHIVDMSLVKALTTTGDWYLYTRLLGEKSLATNTTAVEANASEAGFDFMDGHIDANWGSGFPRSAMWKRAPSYFDVVVYFGPSGAGNISHNLGVVPEMMWVKNTASAENWAVYHKDLGNTYYLHLNTTAAASNTDGGNFWNSTTPTASVFSVGTGTLTSHYTRKHVAYLFATVAGVSKVGNFSLSGSDIDVDCGFSNGARWVMIKRTDGTGNWFQFDTIRGITSGIDSTIYLNTTDDEETADYIDPLSSGFSLVGSAWPSGDYIFYAIA